MIIVGEIVLVVAVIFALWWIGMMVRLWDIPDSLRGRLR